MEYAEVISPGYVITLSFDTFMQTRACFLGPSIIGRINDLCWQS